MPNMNPHGKKPCLCARAAYALTETSKNRRNRRRHCIKISDPLYGHFWASLQRRTHSQCVKSLSREKTGMSNCFWKERKAALLLMRPMRQEMSLPALISMPMERLRLVRVRRRDKTIKSGGSHESEISCHHITSA